MAKTQAIRIADIIISAELQTRGGINENHVEDIAEAIHRKVKVKPPRVMLIDDEADAEHNGKLYAIDQHRVMAYKLMRHQKVPAIRLTGTWQEARDLASSANAEHTGLKRSRADKQRAVVMCLEDHPDWTDGHVAKHCAVSGEMVREWRPQVPAAANVAVEERVGSDGKKRPMPAVNLKPKKAKPEMADVNDPERFSPILDAFTKVSREINEAINTPGNENLLKYLTYLKLIVYPSDVIKDGEKIAGEPRFRAFPGLRRVVRFAALPGRARTEEQVRNEYKRQDENEKR